ncbi:hypothetical protein ACFWC2_02310 [Streptomyces diastaticus]|uniref:hypothetical protein n=1 Tax=Streptomyces diastaticus TaxID=1956 RepID=UPI0013B63F1B|nr:hypothetical protein [Streptomyces sp. SID8455]GFH67303.1 hypothetical protein Srut_38170 [Streptomyces rutgersensis]
MTFKGPGGLARPPREPFTEGHLAVGVIEEAIEDGPSEVQGPDMLIIGADVHGHGVLRRRVTCPLPLPGSGRGLVGRAVGIRHRTHDPDDMDDVRVVRWPVEVGRTLQRCRAGLEGPGAGRARAWRLLAQCSALVSVAGILLTVVSLIVLVSTAGGLFAELPAWFRPGAVLAASAGAALLGPLIFAFCDSRETAALSRSRG